jgi:UDP-N-acetylmuramyl pentapeptide phosphotransferase/UDP-N-acetylglucosamine-1-phosphate transferase
MSVLEALGLSLGSLAASWTGAYIMTKRAGRGAPIVVPNERSSHQRPTVTGGGVGLALALCLSLLVIGSRGHGVPHGEFGLFGIATAIVAAIGLWDVYRDPPGHWRLFLELGAAGLVMGAGMELYQFQMPWGQSITLWWAAIPLTLLWMAGVTNLYNFIDGVDGLATILGIVYSSGIAVVAVTMGHPDEALVAFTIAAGCLGFLWFNFPPARVFMGDVGSLTLGFVFSVLAMRLSASSLHPVPLVFFLILYSSFLFDTSYTILRRALRGEEFWLAHRSHLYERLNGIGWSHLQVTLLYVGLALASLGLAFGYLRAGPVGRTVIVGCQLLICAGQLVFVKAIEGSEYVLLLPRRPKGRG